MRAEDRRDAVAITAMGAVSAFGAGCTALWQGALSARCAFASSDEVVPGQRVRVAAAPRDVRDAGDRAMALCSGALAELCAQPAYRAVDPARLGVCVGSTQGAIERWQRDQRRMPEGGVPATPRSSDPALAVARRTGAGGPVASPSLACASGTAALSLAARWILRGDCDAAIAGGADALSHLVYAGFSALRAVDPETPRPFDARRAGMGLGEGAALLLLQRGVREGAVRLAGAGLSADAAHLTAPDPTGAGLARAITAALQDAGLTPSAVDLISAHGTGTVFNDRMEGQAFLRALGPRAAEVPVASIKGALGHTLAAAGAIEAVLCAYALEHGAMPATVGCDQLDPEIALDVVRGTSRRGDYRCALSTSAGFGGVNAALLLAIGDA